MKYLLPFATCLLSGALAQTAGYSTGFGQPVIDTKEIENKVKADLMMQISSFDYDDAVAGSKKGQNLTLEKDYEMTSANLQQTLSELSALLKDRGVLASMWPDATTDDLEMFDHLNIKIEQSSSKIEIFTAKTNPAGTPIKLKTFDLSENLSIYRPQPPVVVPPTPVPYPLAPVPQYVPAPLAPAPLAPAPLAPAPLAPAPLAPAP